MNQDKKDKEHPENPSEKSTSLDAYQPEYYSVTPSRVVKFFRVFWPWQFIRFLFINFKMIKMIFKSH